MKEIEHLNDTLIVLGEKFNIIADAIEGFAEGMISFGFRGVMVHSLPSGSWKVVMPNGADLIFATATEAILAIGDKVPG